MIEPKYSTFWPRFVAGMVDGIIFIPLQWLFGFLDSHTTSIPLRVFIEIISSPDLLVYSIWMHGRYGQTLGKMLCKVIVLDISERPLSMKQAVLRDIFDVALLPLWLAMDIYGVIEGVDFSQTTHFKVFYNFLAYSSLIWFAIEVITMLTNNKRRALHDFIAGSVVVRKLSSTENPVLLEKTNPSPVAG